MDVLLLGGTGMISTAITRQLVETGHDVTLFNRGETSADVPDAVRQIHGDRFDYDAFETRMAAVDVDAVIDVICFSAADAESAVRAFEGRIDQYVFTSTVDVYHRPVASNPVAEDAPRDPPTSEYGATKAAAEDVFREAHDDGAFAATILRPWHTYGRHGTGGINHTFGNDTYLLDRIRRGQPIVVHGDGTGLWGPCHRRDVARAHVAALGTEPAYGEAFNVTAQQTLTWNEYYRAIARAMDAPDPDLVHVPTDVLLDVAPDRTDMLRDHFQYSTLFETSKASRVLDFEQTIDWERGVGEVIEWLESAGAIQDSEAVPFDDALIDAWRAATGDFHERFEAPT